MFREIRTSERITEEDEKKELGFMKIEPEQRRSIDELHRLVRDMFDQVAREAI